MRLQRHSWLGRSGVVLRWLLPAAVVLCGIALLIQPVAPRIAVGEAGQTGDGGHVWER